MTVASLGFKIDSTQASSAAVDLERLYAAAAKMETAAESLTTSAGALAGALRRVGDETKKVPPVARPFQNQDEHVRAFRAEIERLTVKYQPLANAQKNYAAAVSEINRAHQLGIINAQQMQKALDGERLAFERLKTSATTAGTAVKAANQNGVSGAQRAAGINAGYQFQDVAVTSAMGMSPLMIGLQQGTQLASVLAAMERPVMGLGAAFASIISPVTLVTVGLTAGVAALIQYFSTSEDGSGKMEADLERQSELIQTVAARWGDAAPALKAYADELERAREEQDKQEASATAAELKIKGLRGEMEGLVSAIGRMDTDFALSNAINSADTEKVSIFRKNMVDVKDAIEAGKDPTLALNSALESLSTILGDKSNPVIKEFYDLLSGAADKMREVADQAKSFTSLPRLSPLWSENGRILGDEMFIPRVPGIPTSRPSDLAGDPDVADSRILNSDGRFTAVPVPTEKPNFFELEKENEKVDEVTKAYLRAQEAKANFWLDVSFAERQAGRSAMDRQIATTLTRYGFDENLNSPEANAIRQQLQWKQAKDLAQSFGDAFSSELLSGSHDIGKAFLKGLEAAISGEASKLWEKFFDGIGTIFADWLTGSKGGTGAGANAVGAVAAKPLGLGGSAANDNFGKAPVVPVSRSLLGDIGSYATAIKAIESSGGNYSALGPVTRTGDRAYGAYQVMGANIPSWTKSALGTSLTPNEFLGSKSAQDAVFEKYFGASVAKYGNPQDAASVWFTGRPLAQGANSADVLGTTGKSYVNKFNAELEKASKGLGEFGGGLGKLGSTLESIPQALMANGGGGGILSGLTKYGMGLFSGSSQFASAWLKGGVGLYADGTNYAPGGLAIVGERGPELVNLPQGSKVFNTNKSQDMMAANGNDPKVQPPKYDIHIYGGSGDQHIRDLVQQGIAAAQGEQSYQMRRGGFGDMQRRYSNQKG
ncbi:phage tail length tape measure family protein [Shinella zoogloeoides]|uniref:phage tail length tape measure family protein n=1 Tax=Shinella zoogloeoides TaxID=352475 RepID=UPI00299F259F|nr:phage tail length tape measure family protein [Shinella zoogloeoides]WPE22508.1 hypothetical protein ShzoTeo12_37240 [Shinella zoogloeoides]